ncbi:MAG: TlpA family protein disulfide reductase, partial [Chloroflexi bacterium]|nr:TlpA family protein disulfide reductase [Chloroflexota bacterium]
MAAMASLPAFSLRDQSAGERRFPSGRPALLAFVKEDCPTCGTSMPLIEGAHRAFGDGVDVWAVGQEAEGNAVLVDRYGLTLPMLDDSELGVSFRYDLDTVPTVLLAGADGEELRRFVGFGRDDWRSLYAQLGELCGAAAPPVAWDEYPESEPGCGARNVEPGIAERLAALAEGSPLLARRIEIGSADDPAEFMGDQGCSA